MHKNVVRYSNMRLSANFFIVNAIQIVGLERLNALNSFAKFYNKFVVNLMYNNYVYYNDINNAFILFQNEYLYAQVLQAVVNPLGAPDGKPGHSPLELAGHLQTVS